MTDVLDATPVAALPIATETAAPQVPAVINPEPSPPTQVPAPAGGAPAPQLLEAPPTGFLAQYDAEQAAAAEPSAPPATSAPSPGEQAKAVEPAAQAAPPAPAPEPPQDVFTHAFALPPSLHADEARMDIFRAILADAPKDLIAAGQKLIDFHNEAMLAWDAELRRQQHAFFNKTQEGWHRQVLADPELGGSGHQTAMGVVARMRDELVSSANRNSTDKKEVARYWREMAEFNYWLQITGSSNHIVPLRILHNAGALLDVPRQPEPETKPPPFYQPPASRADALYDNPRSQVGRP